MRKMRWEVCPFVPSQNSPISTSAILSTSVRDIGAAVLGHSLSICRTKADGVTCGMI